MQMVAGLFQATGWPSVVAIIGNWFGKRERRLIMGNLNAYTSVEDVGFIYLHGTALGSVAIPGDEEAQMAKSRNSAVQESILVPQKGYPHRVNHFLVRRGDTQV
ncbi:hypothetical protein L6164_028038 [Bauhinia variegata]|uniref:Uncharacterized protein n=1 Tax=Bauhinia variegata TaxID=167791 RepID=A0ACB9LV89_BAUVA|nr:hypothetical protein L6164_028038 [Bauhinia variegata]